VSTFKDRELLTPFGEAVCGERVDYADTSFWICWQKETSICFWWRNQEVRLAADWSNGRYRPLPFKLAPERIAALDGLGQLHSYWRENIKGATPDASPKGDGK
jgi:hypothetical protein